MPVSRYVVIAAALLGGLSSSHVLADQNTGVIENVHLNANIPGRGACFHMNPAVPNVGGNWACLWKVNPLYNETTALIISAVSRGSSCTVFWDQMDASGIPIVVLLDCGR